MAQTLLLTPGVSAHTSNLKKDSLVELQLQKLKPTSSFSSHIFFSPLPFHSPRPSAFKVLAVFKSKAKAAPTKGTVSISYL